MSLKSSGTNEKNHFNLAALCAPKEVYDNDNHLSLIRYNCSVSSKSDDRGEEHFDISWVKDDDSSMQFALRQYTPPMHLFLRES